MEEAEPLFKFEKENKDYFERFVPPRPIAYFEFDSFKVILEGLLEEQTAKKSFFYLIKNDRGEIAGRMNLVEIDWQNKTGEIGYRVGETFIGKGIAAKGLALLVEEAEYMGLRSLNARTTLENKASQKVLEKNGFEKISDNDDGFVFYKNRVETYKVK